MVDAGRRMLDVVDGKRGERGGLQGWGGCLMQAGGRLVLVWGEAGVALAVLAMEVRRLWRQRTGGADVSRQAAMMKSDQEMQF